MDYHYGAITIDNKGMGVRFSAPKSSADSIIANFKELFLKEQVDDNPESILPTTLIKAKDFDNGKQTAITITVDQRRRSYLKQFTDNYDCVQFNTIDITFLASFLPNFFFDLGVNLNNLKENSSLDINLIKSFTEIRKNQWKFIIRGDFATVRLICPKNTEKRILDHLKNSCAANELKFFNLT
jgi:hypothetical protein